MAFLKIDNVAIRGIAACVPKKVEENKSLPFYAQGEAELLIEAIGIERRHIAPEGVTASDLCCKAAEELLSHLGWERDSIDLLAFVTQCPDYINLPDSFVVHDKLGLKEETMCVDYYHGCPGWVVGLSSVASMVSAGGRIKRALLLDGDTCSKMQYANDREEKPLFGDAGTATAIEYETTASPLFFNIGTKSEDAKALIKLIGGFRNPYTVESLKHELDMRAGLNSDFASTGKMDGMDVFSFAITKAPKSMKKLCSEFGVNIEDVDNLFLHQANKLIIESIAKRMKVSMDYVPSSLKNYGNTTSVSIPLTMVVDRKKQLESTKQKNLACAFGTGLAWGAVYFETDHIIVPEIIEL